MGLSVGCSGEGIVPALSVDRRSNTWSPIAGFMFHLRVPARWASPTLALVLFLRVPLHKKDSEVEAQPVSPAVELPALPLLHSTAGCIRATYACLPREG